MTIKAIIEATDSAIDRVVHGTGTWVWVGCFLLVLAILTTFTAMAVVRRVLPETGLYGTPSPAPILKFSHTTPTHKGTLTQ